MVEHCREWATDTESLVWVNDQQRELSEGGIVFLPKDIPHAYRITSKKGDLLMINTPAGIEGMFRATGRDKSTTRPLEPNRLGARTPTRRVVG